MAPLSLVGSSIAGGASQQHSPRQASKQSPLGSSLGVEKAYETRSERPRRRSEEAGSKASPLLVRRSSLQLPPPQRSPVNSPGGSCAVSRQCTIEEDACMLLGDQVANLRLQSIGRPNAHSLPAVRLIDSGIGSGHSGNGFPEGGAEEGSVQSTPSNASRRLASFADASEGTEPEELMKGLEPRPLGPRTAAMRPEELENLETFIIDCDGLLWNPEDFLSDGGDPDDYFRENSAAVNALIETDKRLVFLDSKAQPSRQALLERLQHCGVRVDRLKDMPVVTPGLTTAWYLQRQGLKKPFVLTSQGSLLADVKAGGFPDCASSIRDEEQTSAAFFDAKPSMASFQSLLANIPDADAVVLGPLGKQEITVLEAALCVHILQKGGPSGIPVTCCGSQPRRRLKSVAGSMSCKVLAAFAEGEQPQTFVDMLLPSGLVLAALAGDRASGGFGVDFSKAVMVGRSLEKTCGFAHKCGLASLVIVDNVLGQVEISKESQHQRLPDWVASSLSRLLP